MSQLRRIPLFLLLWVCTLPPIHAGAQQSVFKIGFIKDYLEQGIEPQIFERLRLHLLSHSSPQLREVLNVNEFRDIVVIPADGFRDMVRRMNHNEFELVFCAPLVYEQQTGDYRVILQLRRPRDIWDSRGGGKVMQQGVVFVNNRSPLFKADPLEPEQIAAYLKRQVMAFVSSYSAPGYLFPLMEMRTRYRVDAPAGFIFCDTSEEVVKYVVNGLVEVGACESGTIEEVLRTADILPEKDTLVRILFQTSPLPTDPVVIRKEFHPSVSTLGQLIKTEVRAFYATLPERYPRLENSRESYFQPLREEVEKFYHATDRLK